MSDVRQTDNPTIENIKILDVELWSPKLFELHPSIVIFLHPCLNYDDITPITLNIT